MHNFLITGGAGFVGSNFVRFLLANEPDVRVINLDALTYAGSRENLRELPDPDRHIFIHGNICDRNLIEEIIRKYSIDRIIHFAAETHVDRSIVDPEPFVQTNMVGTYTLLEAARKMWIQERDLPADQVHFHHVSTDEVFGSLRPGEHAFTEQTPYAPNSPYAATKAAGDHLVRAYHHTYHLPVTITNCSNNYGPYMFPEKLIPLTIFNALEGKPLPIYGDGKQIRDWLFVEDHCDAIWTVIRKGKIGETYNIGGNNQPENLTVVRTICRILDERVPDSHYVPHESLIKFVLDRPGHDRRYAMDITKIKNELGWLPRHTLSEGLHKTVDWYLSHPGWVESIRKQSEYQKWMEKNYGKRGEMV